MENQINFSSLELTPSFAYETDKIPGNGHLEISVGAYRYEHRHRNRHVNVTIVFYTISPLKFLNTFVKHVIFNKKFSQKKDVLCFFKQLVFGIFLKKNLW